MQHRLPEKPTGQQTTVVKDVVADLVAQGRIEKLRKEDRMRYQVRPRR